MKMVITCAVALIFAAAPARTQEVFSNPSVTYLIQTYGIDKAEAQLRIDLQADIMTLSDRMNAAGDETYGDIYIQHEPVFKIMILFADKADRKAFLENLDPKIRRYVQLKQAKKSRGQAARELDELSNSLNARSIAYSSKYDLAEEAFVITVENESDAAQVRSLLPQNRKVETTVRIAPLPKPAIAPPTGVVAGDAVRGGESIWSGAGGTGGACTLGYAVSFTSGGIAKQGILSAGHCYASMKAYLTNHDVTFLDPLVRKPAKVGGITPDNISDKYDYLIWETTGLAVSSTISYIDKSSIPEFPATGTLKMTGVSTFLNQKAGMVVCKSGHTTGITCGQITNGNATHNGVAGWIEASKSQQALFADQGDSGGPVFYYPGTSTNITGVGITTASNLVAGPTGILIYMPIDYIDDHFATVNTLKN